MLKDYIDSGLYSHNRDEFFKIEWEKKWTKRVLREEESLRKDELLPLLKRYLPKHGEILEAGCGTGKYVRYFWKQGYNIRGVEYEPEITNRLKREVPSVPIDEGDLRKLPYADNSYTWYVSLGVIEHYEEGPREILKEAVRLLVPGGRIFLTVPFVSVPLLLERRLKRALGKDTNSNIAENKSFWQYRFTKKEIINLITSYGFQVENIHYTSIMNGFYDRINVLAAAMRFKALPHRKLAVSLSRYTLLPLLRPFAHMIVIVASLKHKNACESVKSSND
jgi:SAM-dependent methyltransferase